MTRRPPSREAEIEFQPHVPEAVRNFILSEVGVTGSTDSGALTNRLASAERLIKMLCDAAAPGKRGSLAEQLQEARTYKVELERQLDDYRKLASSEAMREAYAHLMVDFTNPSEWSRFLRAAVEAHKDYRLERQRITVAEALQDKIVDQCEKLLSLVTRYQVLSAQNIRGPLEFVHIPNLVWCPSLEWQEVWHDGAEAARFWRFTPRPGDRAHTRQAATAEVIARLIDAGLAFEAAPTSNAVAAATSSKKNNPNTEYVRAFWSLLQRNFGPRSHKGSRLYKPVAITATVILDAPDVVVSYDDVRKAVGAKRAARHRKMRLSARV